jgi:YbbR domain-containing protein
MKEGEHIFQVLPEDLKLPPGVNVVRISPARFRVALAKEARQQLPVRPILEGKPAPGFEVGEVTFRPEVVTASGPKKNLADLEWIWTLPIDITGLKKNLALKVRLRLPKGPISLDREEVEALVTVKPKSPAEPTTKAEDETS